MQQHNRRALRLIVWCEQRIFPMMYLLMAFKDSLRQWHQWSDQANGYSNMQLVHFLLFLSERPTQIHSHEILAALQFSFFRPLAWILMYVVVAVLLILPRPSRTGPTNFSEALFPLLAQIILLLPETFNVLPLSYYAVFDWYHGSWYWNAVFLGAALSLGGLILSFSALLYLGRSFSISVQLYRLVQNGPYRYFRHPMYIGQVMMAAGFAIAFPSVFSVNLLLVLTLIQVYRAVLENRRIMQEISLPGDCLLRS